MTHPYRLSESASQHLATAAAIARDVLAAHAADVDTNARFPGRASTRSRAPACSVSRCPARTADEARTCVPSPRSPRSSPPRAASTAMIYVMHVAASQAIASGQNLARSRRPDAPAGHRRAPDDARVLGTRVAVPVLGSGVEARAGGCWLPHPGREVVGDLGGARTVVRLECAEAGAASPLESTVYLVRSGCAGREQSPAGSTGSACAATIPRRSRWRMSRWPTAT